MLQQLRTKKFSQRYPWIYYINLVSLVKLVNIISNNVLFIKPKHFIYASNNIRGLPRFEKSFLTLVVTEQRDS